MLKKTENNERDEILNEMEHLKELIEKNDQVFNIATDEDLIDAVIYEQISLRHRFAHLIKTAKEKGIKIDYIDRQ